MATNKGRSEADAVTQAPSQAQSTAAGDAVKDKPTPEEAVKRGSAQGAGEAADVQFFDGSITKIDRDGNEVMSDHLEAGETLRRASTDRYAAVKQPDEDK